MTVELSEATEQRLAAVFPEPSDRDHARRLLEDECGEKVPLWGEYTKKSLERIRFAVLKISDGSLDALVDAIALAQSDWRDALVAAGFGNSTRAHLRWRPQ